MKASLILAALSLLAAPPLAHALQIVQGNSVPAADAPRVADPEDVRDSFGNQSSLSGGSVTATPFGSRFHFGGSSASGGGLFSSPGPFLENPASRTVPSQRY